MPVRTPDSERAAFAAGSRGVKVESWRKASLRLTKALRLGATKPSIAC
jgi:hypothetical protein